MPPGQLPPWPLREYLDLLRVNFNNDVCGAPYPRSGINYLSAAGLVLQVVKGIDAALAHARHSIRIAATPPGAHHPDPTTMLALLLEADDACLEAVANEFEELNAGYWGYNYWDVVEAPHRRIQRKTKRKSDDGLPAEPETCVVM